MLLDLSLGWTLTLNVIGWPLIHLAVAWLATKLPRTAFTPSRGPCRIRSWEMEGRFYERWLGVHRWKKFLPDGGSWFGGAFSKKHLPGRSTHALEAFVAETCRGEIVHWLVMLATPLFFLFNPPWACLVMLGYGVLANLPCIIAQRYNRPRLLRILAHKKIKPNNETPLALPPNLAR